MNRICAVLLFAGLGFGLVTAPRAAETFHALKGSEIRARFAGMELTDGVHWSYRVRPRRTNEVVLAGQARRRHLAHPER